MCSTQHRISLTGTGPAPARLPVMFDQAEQLLGHQDVSGWLTIDRAHLSEFAHATYLDPAYVDLTPSRNHALGPDLVDGFLLLSLLVQFEFAVPLVQTDGRYGYNYGLDRVRFTAPGVRRAGSPGAPGSRGRAAEIGEPGAGHRGSHDGSRGVTGAGDDRALADALRGRQGRAMSGWHAPPALSRISDYPFHYAAIDPGRPALLFERGRAELRRHGRAGRRVRPRPVRLRGAARGSGGGAVNSAPRVLRHLPGDRASGRDLAGTQPGAHG